MAEQRGTVGGPVLTEWFGKANLHKLDVYEKLGGYEGLRKVVTGMNAAQVIDEVKASGLRGRGGADFPTATKWSFVPKDHPGPKYIVVNADESEPGSAKDRYLMENSPHALVEGAAIATFAIGGHQAWIYIRGEYDLPYEMLRDAIAEAHAKGYLGEHPFGSDYALDVRLYRGHGAYICGEETALLESLEGKRAQPRSRPPFPAIKGAWGQPTAVNNVETLSTVPWIIRHGGAEYAKRGTEKAKGTRIVTVSGDVQKPGNYEIEIGVTYRAHHRRARGRRLPGSQDQGVLAGRLVGEGPPRLDARHLDRPRRPQGARDDGRLRRDHRDGRLALRRQGGRPPAALLRPRVVRQVHALPRRQQLGGAHLRAHPGQRRLGDRARPPGSRPAGPAGRALPVRPRRRRRLGHPVDDGPLPQRVRGALPPPHVLGREGARPCLT